MSAFSPSTLALLALPLLLVAHVLHVRHQRHKLRRSIEALFLHRYALSAEDEARGLPRMTQADLRGIRDAQYIWHTLASYEMPWVSLKSLEIAVFRTYGIPTISRILMRTGQLGAKEKSSRRFVDTGLLVASFFTYPIPRLDLQDNDVARPGEEDYLIPDDPRSAIALARVNFLHRRANGIHGPKGAGISNDDLVYTLSTFVFQPVRFYKVMGYREATPLEEEALYAVFYHVGRCMGMHSIPATREAFAAWAEAYEVKHLICAESNVKLAERTVDVLLAHAPKALRPALSHVIACVMDERLRLAVGFAAPPTWLKTLMQGVFMTFGAVQRHLCLPRRHACGIAPYANENISGLQGIGMCPATGAMEGEGKTCPVGASEKGEAKARMHPHWAESDPHYMPPVPRYSLYWFYERFFVAEEQRWGAKKWAGKGYRLEECGPRGLERIGHAEILAEATRLHGKPLTGIWAFEPHSSGPTTTEDKSE